MKLDLQNFCLFMGYARSGSSAVGSIIDAHPNAVISHELNVVSAIVRRGWDSNKIFESILNESQKLNEEGRWSGGANGEVYQHVVDGQIKEESSIIRVIGDKKSGATTRIFQSKHHTPIDQRKDKIKRLVDTIELQTQLPCKFIHVIRNPYDIVAAQKQSRINFRFGGFFQGVKTIALAKEMYPDQWLDVYREDLINRPIVELWKINQFLGLSHEEKHIEAAVKHLKFKPKLRRFEIEWHPHLKSKIKGKIIQPFGFFNRYTFKI